MDSQGSSRYNYKLLYYIYASLENLQFERSDLESVLKYLISKGPSITDKEELLQYCLDWLLLNVPHDSLPRKFKDKNYYTTEQQQLTLIPAKGNINIFLRY